MGQRLTAFKFSKIMNSIDDFIVEKVTRSQIEEHPQYELLHFWWRWQGYSGFGNIYLKNGIIDMSDIWCRDSELKISSTSERQPSIHYSNLSNEPELISVFEHIVNNYIQ